VTRIAHISDLHFGRDVADVDRGLVAALRQFTPDLTVVSGDLTQRATHAQFRAARRFLRRLPQPCLVIPGNHDIPGLNLVARFFFPWRRWQQHLGMNLAPVVDGEAFTAAGINTVRRMGWYLDWSRGRIGRSQARHVRRILQSAPSFKLRVVAAHHPFWLPPAHRERRIIGGRDDVLSDFRAAGVDLILGGHIHQPYIHQLSGMIVAHAGSTLSDRLSDGRTNSLNLIEGDRRSLQIRTVEWNGKRFGRTAVTRRFVRAAGGFVESAEGEGTGGPPGNDDA
jgi:3',5'-cyclic AMP phosphodiesterase CpdA